MVLPTYVMVLLAEVAADAASATSEHNKNESDLSGPGIQGYPENSAVGRESRDGKFPGIPGILAFPFPGKRGSGRN